MLPKLSERLQAVLFVAILIAAIAGVYGIVQVLQPAAVNTYVVQRVHLVVEAPDWSLRYDPTLTSNNTAFSLLLEAATAFSFSVRFSVYEIPRGALVTEINGFVNGQGPRYWQYWVNDAYGRVASDHMALHDDDTVRWNFTSSQEGA